MKLDVYCIPVLGDIEFGENTFRISVNIGNFYQKRLFVGLLFFIGKENTKLNLESKSKSLPKMKPANGQFLP